MVSAGSVVRAEAPTPVATEPPAPTSTPDPTPTWRHGLSIFGDLKYPADFKHFDYVNPDAPKGGRMSLIGPGSVTTFDSFNMFIIQGDNSQGLELLYDSLMVRAHDEPDAVYGLVARAASVAPDKMSITFQLRPEARFADGTPLTAADVVFSFEKLRDKKIIQPYYSLPLSDVLSAEALDAVTVKYTFKGNFTRDLPIVVAMLPILPKAYYDTHPFDQTTLDPPLGSGPYKIAGFRPQTSVTYVLRPDYWARDLPVNRGRFNIAEIRYDFFRDRTPELQGLFTGDLDFREEFTSVDWATAYDNVPAIRDGRLLRDTRPDEAPSGAQGFFINTRREKFKDVRVRRALDLLFDFEWSNKALFYGLYKRTESYFENSDLKAFGPPSPAELALLEPYRTQLPPEIFGEPYTPPRSNGSGKDSKLLAEADRLLTAAGWTVENGRRVNAKKEPLAVEVLVDSAGFERIAVPYQGTMRLMGIEATVRRVDSAQYQRRLETFDFDLTTQRYVMRLTPGIELINYWSSATASIEASRNLPGIADPVVDALMLKVMAAKSREELAVATRAVDRVLRAGNYWVPQWHKASHHLAYWNKYSWPAIKPRYDRALDTWWFDADKAAKLMLPK